MRRMSTVRKKKNLNSSEEVELEDLFEEKLGKKLSESVDEIAVIEYCSPSRQRLVRVRRGQMHSSLTVYLKIRNSKLRWFYGLVGLVITVCASWGKSAISRWMGL